MALNTNAQNILNAIVLGAATREAVASRTDIEKASVSAAIRSLKNNGLIEEVDGLLEATDDGRDASTARRRRVGTKAEKARDVFRQTYQLGRQAVLEALKSKCQLTDKGAITYFQNLRNETGLTGAVAMKSAAGTKRTVQRASR